MIFKGLTKNYGLLLSLIKFDTFESKTERESLDFCCAGHVIVFLTVLILFGFVT